MSVEIKLFNNIDINYRLFELSPKKRLCCVYGLNGVGYSVVNILFVNRRSRKDIMELQDIHFNKAEYVETVRKYTH